VALNNFDNTQLMPEKPEAGFAFFSSKFQIRLRLKFLVRILLDTELAVQKTFAFMEPVRIEDVSIAQQRITVPTRAMEVN